MSLRRSSESHGALLESGDHPIPALQQEFDRVGVWTTGAPEPVERMKGEDRGSFHERLAAVEQDQIDSLLRDDTIGLRLVNPVPLARGPAVRIEARR